MAIKGDVTGLSVLMYGGKPMVPQAANGGFSRYRKSGVITSEAAGGASRQRKKYFGNTHIAEVVFYLETAQQQDFMELFVLKNEGMKFICYLAADRPVVEPYVVQILGDVKYSSVTAKDSICSMTLEIFTARDSELDDFLLEMYPVFPDLSYMLLSFREIVELMPSE